MNENLLFAAITALVCLPLSLALAAAGLPLASASMLLNPPKRVKVFRDKYGQQTATFCLLAGIIATACLGAAAGFLPMVFPAAASFWLGWPLPLAPLAALLVLCAVLAVAYRATWQILKENRPAHAAMGMAATVCGWGLGYLFLSFFRHFAVSSADPAADPTLFLPPLDSASWLLLPSVLALTLAMAGASAPLYLIYRREKDDFGRDYYNYALKMAGKWALGGSAGALASQGALFALLWPVVRDMPIRASFFWGEAVALTAFVMAGLLWSMVLKNQNPLRLKLHCVTGYALAVAGLSGMAVAVSRFFFG
ncbi:hypothetical protein [Fundidesulfovibrio terrae]|uniref:hypothetical protein n=1 Tax=Fundidesulfovibrio terrae TaxID=2922866 RepID=UPI001FAFA8AC|nr:hypothetical protein [Fundidesulfovibrio terrae]